jgi:alcohol dehydrogenase class IV
MHAISLVAPRKILIGGGTLAKLPALLAEFGLSRPLVVTDPWMVSSGLIDRVLAPLASAGFTAHVFSDTVADPTDTVVKAGVAMLKGGISIAWWASAAAARWIPPRPWPSWPPPAPGR